MGILNQLHTFSDKHLIVIEDKREINNTSNTKITRQCELEINFVRGQKMIEIINLINFREYPRESTLIFYVNN